MVQEESKEPERNEDEGEQWIGIDLGTSNSMVTYFKLDVIKGSKINGRIEVVQNINDNNIITPSVVFFNEKNEKNPLIGYAAKEKMVQQFEQVCYDSKRILGRNFGDPEIQEYRKTWPFILQKGLNDKPQYKLIIKDKDNSGEDKDQVQTYYPQEISSFILNQLRRNVENTLERKNCRNCVVTIPAYFNQSQIDDTYAACKQAGLNCKGMIDEPTSAAVYYTYMNYQKDQPLPGSVLVVDYGGGTLDTSIVEIDDN